LYVSVLVIPCVIFLFIFFGSHLKENDHCCSDGVLITHFDLNNPLNAWPIILKSKMEMYAYSKSTNGEVTEQGWTLTGRFFDKKKEFQCVRVNDKNPLRAAMIVFLKMRAKEDE